MGSFQDGMKNQGEFRKYLPDLTSDRFLTLKSHDAHQHIASFNERRNPPRAHALFQYWKQLWQEPLKGVTNDGAHIVANVLSQSRTNLPLLYRKRHTGLIQASR